MGPILSGLLELQRVDLELREAKKKLRKGQKAVLRQHHLIDQLNNAHQAKKEEIKLSRVQADGLELELKTDENEISKLRVALNTAKTNKDYSAILTRINTDKVDKSKLEDQILAIMSQIENDETECREIEENTKTQQEKRIELERIAEERSKQIKIEVEALEKKWQGSAQDVPEKELSLFERLADSFDGEVLVEIIEPKSRRGVCTCGGCFMTVPLEIVNALLTKDEVITCDCGRILMLSDGR